MTTSGTYNFNPSAGQITLYAFNLCGIRNTALVQEHFESARMAANLVLMDWSNRGVNLWKVELVTVPLVQGVPNYSVSPSVVYIMDAYISITGGIDRYIIPVSRTEYASYSNKSQQGFPTTYWHDRLLAPTLVLWPVPDGSEGPLNYYAMQQVQDVAFTSGQQMDVPPIWFMAFADALALELSYSWAGDRTARLEGKALRSYQAAAATNVENADVFISPTMSQYWR